MRRIITKRYGDAGFVRANLTCVGEIPLYRVAPPALQAAINGRGIAAAVRGQRKAIIGEVHIVPHAPISCQAVIPSAAYFTIRELMQDAICVFVRAAGSTAENVRGAISPDMPLKAPANHPPRRLSTWQAAKRAADYAARAAKAGGLIKLPEPVSAGSDRP
jgi:hypothetical protein